MRQKIDKKLIKRWVNSVGGPCEAVKKIMAATDVAPDTAQKLARGSYPSEPQFLIRKTLCELTGLSEEKLFPFVSAKGKAS